MIATLENFSREELDALAVESQNRAQHAIANGYFDRSVMPVHNDDGTVALDREEFPRPGTTLESLAALPTVFSMLWTHRLTIPARPFSSWWHVNTQTSTSTTCTMLATVPVWWMAPPL
jgi:acetyl-CoA acetyltransferase